MEAMFAAHDGDNLDLNIICEDKPVPQRTPQKKRKLNKYERRRAKARQARPTARAPSSGQVQVSSEEVDKPSSPANSQTQNTEELDFEESIEISNPKKDSQDPENEEKFPPATATTAPPYASRKHHQQNLQDTAERSKYMAEFHARPLEMDRRSGAVSTIAPSRESSHIFDTQQADSFAALQLHPKLVSTLTGPKFHLHKPTVIQTRSIQILQSNPSCNLFVHSETGSGKTLAYLLPIVQSLAVHAKTEKVHKMDRHEGGTRCLILCPTRELASQTYLVASKLCLGSFHWLVAGCLSGGEKRKTEKARLRKGISILIATPGRCLDHLAKTESLLMSLKGKLEWLVFDEADRLLDMGLGSQIERMVQLVRANQSKSGPKRDGVTWRSVLVSATVSNHVETLAMTMLGGDEWRWARASNASENSSGGQDMRDSERLALADSTPRQLGQVHMMVNAKLRLATLVAFLVQRVANTERTVVFMSTCDGVEYHYALFSAMDSILTGNVSDRNDNDDKKGIFGAACSIYRLHGSVPHAERLSILKEFNETSEKKHASLLLATDVAARGLNLTGVDWTVQYDPPCEVADYAHRAGRAARAGRAGHSLLFLLPSERPFLEVLKLKGLDVPQALSVTSTLDRAADICHDLMDQAKRHFGKTYAQTGADRPGEAFCTEVQSRFENCVSEDDAKAKAAAMEKSSMTKSRSGIKRVRQEEANGRLLDLARKAYMSFVRSYPTKEKAVKYIFSARALHLGHIARSFALKDPPKSLVSKGRREDKTTERKRNMSFAFA